MSDCVLTLDVGSSSARTVLFGFDGKLIPGVGSSVKYRGTASSDGGWQVDPEALAGICEQAISDACEHMGQKNLRPSAVGFDTFWQHILGVGADGRPVTALIHVFDTRSAPQAKVLATRLDDFAQHQRTGAPLHPSYIPAKLLWLAETQPEAFGRAKRWMTFGEFFFLRLFGKAVAATSMASGSGLWNQRANDYDPEIFSVLPVDASQFASPGEMDAPQTRLLPPYAAKWKALDGIPWFPALGDGACDSVGSGCTRNGEYAVMIGTSGAMRVIAEEMPSPLPPGLFCYRLDRQHYVSGGALSNGGEVYAWCKRTLLLPDDVELERQIAAMEPGSHELTMVPLFAGERSIKWRPDAKGAITGLEFTTTPVEMVRAALEAVALRFREVYEQLRLCTSEPGCAVASGGALLRSRAWVGMIADAVNCPVVECAEDEATARGAAVMALARIGAIASIHDLPPALGETVNPRPENHAVYMGMLGRQRAFYAKLFEEKW